VTSALPYRVSPDDIVTYSLRCGRPGSDDYYRRVDDLTQEVRHHGAQVLWTVLPLAGQVLLHPGGRAQTLFEVLTLGVLWRTHGAGVSAAGMGGRVVLADATASRDRGRRVASSGRRHDKLLASEDCVAGAGNDRHPLPTPDGLNGLLAFLAEAQAYEFELKPLGMWRDRLSHLPGQDWLKTMDSIDRFAGWFEARSLEILGSFTQRVEQFVASQATCASRRQDASLRRRRRLEYHLNMVGTELLNHACRLAAWRAERLFCFPPACA
jgi:hypothetical protein